MTVDVRIVSMSIGQLRSLYVCSACLSNPIKSRSGATPAHPSFVYHTVSGKSSFIRLITSP